MKRNNSSIVKGQKKAENLLYAALWLILYIAPVFTEFVNEAVTHRSFNWFMVTGEWMTLSVLFLVFCLHNYLLAPMLVYRKRVFTYLLLLVMLLVSLGAFQRYFSPHRRWRGPRPARMEMLRPKMADDVPPHPWTDDGQSPENRRFSGRRGRHKRRDVFMFELGSRETIMFTFVFLMVLANVGVKYYFKSADDRKRMQRLEKENLQQQLAYLKYQINPHFFMNTLNNIHALVSINPPQAEKMIEMLSRLMRYVLYDGNKSLSPLQREQDFLRDYVNLMRIRYASQVRITLSLSPSVDSTAMVPPLLYVTFVENAFKHGISYEQDSFVEVSLIQAGGRVEFCCRNSRPRCDNSKPGGVGIANVKQRLRLIYHNDFLLQIHPTSTDYSVRLSVPLTPQSV